MKDHDAWTERKWLPYRKHLPPSIKTKDWESLVRETAERGHKGYYHHDLIGRIEEIETLCLEKGRFLYQRTTIRYYWMEFDHITGASSGRSTRFLLVEHHRSGHFHGHPVTWEELKSKGARDDERTP